MNERIYLIEGREEFTDFLREKDILFKRTAQDSLDALTWIDIKRISVDLLSIILLLKQWHQEKNKQSNVTFNINQNITLTLI